MYPNKRRRHMPFVEVNTAAGWLVPSDATRNPERQKTILELGGGLPRIVANAINLVDRSLIEELPVLDHTHVIVTFGELGPFTIHGPGCQVIVRPGLLDQSFIDAAGRRSEIRDHIATGIVQFIEENPELLFPDMDLEVLPVACSGCGIDPNGRIGRKWGDPHIASSRGEGSS